MRIGIDARPLLGQQTGIGKYVHGLLESLGAEGQGHEFILYTPRPLAFQRPNGRWSTHVHRGIDSISGTLWLQLYGPRFADQDKLDLFWGAHFLLPLRLTPRIPAIVTVYDLVSFLFPETMEMRNYLALRLLLPRSLARAQRVVTISQTVAASLHESLGLAHEKIHVIPPGVGPQFTPRDPEEARTHVASAMGLTKPYMLAVGTVEPRKNIITIVKAFAALPPIVRNSMMLVVAGAGGWKNSPIHAAAGPLERDGTVRFLGYVSDADLPWLYAGATALLFPSLYEGFGMPIIEAMASGTPVIASDIPVIREVAGEAAVLVLPGDVRGWAQAVERTADDERTRNMLRERGFHRAARFTFEASARRLLEVCERLDLGHSGAVVA